MSTIRKMSCFALCVGDETDESDENPFLSSDHSIQDEVIVAAASNAPPSAEKETSLDR